MKFLVSNASCKAPKPRLILMCLVYGNMQVDGKECSLHYLKQLRERVYEPTASAER